MCSKERKDSSEYSDDLIRELINAARDDKNVKKSGKELGKSALTITKTINNALLPLAMINYGFEKARIYFAENFKSDMEEKAKDIPLDRLIEPKPSVAGPALQGLAFSHEEESLKEMYLNLLKSSMDSESSDSAHPAFVEIIKQMSSEEAELAASLLRPPGSAPIVEMRLTREKSGTWDILARNVININKKTSPHIKESRVPAIVDNLIRLGLVEADYTSHLASSGAYDWVEKRLDIKHLRATVHNDEVSIDIKKGVLKSTSFGLQFAHAVGILD